MKSYLKFVFVFLLSALVYAQSLTPEQIIKKVDQNLNFNSAITISEMEIFGVRGKRTIKAKSWAQGRDKAFTEYLAPAREKGTKMLKLGDELWIYSPQADRTIKIAGHMLRQSVVGSDLSYEDFMENESLLEDYTAKLVALDTLKQRPCFVLELTAKRSDVSYFKRKIWVDQQRFIPLKEELFASSGKILKKMEILKVEKIGQRWYPKEIRFKDMMKESKGTIFRILQIQFDVHIPPFIFSKASLR
ncbi:outer membrane lipoprotein-sorting protein [candidate division KSB1 bacterium]|nr:MAG: outer membrane lipoprotein-sorting protein [candidate division KSB1 bacterium]